MTMTVRTALREVYSYFTAVKAMENLDPQKILDNTGSLSELEINEERLAEAFNVIGEVAYAPIDLSSLDDTLEVIRK